MYPHERSLVQRLAEKPFALIGVNSDRDREQLKETMQKEGITWRSFWNGGSTSGPISTKWNVRGWPTMYILDHEGIIRHKFLGSPGGETLDRLINEILEEMGVPVEADTDADEGEDEGASARVPD
jgi:hypothetical protein